MERRKGGELMKISETHKTEHEIICIHWDGIDDKVHETWVDINKDSDGELLTVSIGAKEITALDLQVLNFLKKEGKL